MGKVSLYGGRILNRGARRHPRIDNPAESNCERYGDGRIAVIQGNPAQNAVVGSDSNLETLHVRRCGPKKPISPAADICNCSITSVHEVLCKSLSIYVWKNLTGSLELGPGGQHTHAGNVEKIKILSVKSSIRSDE